MAKDSLVKASTPEPFSRSKTSNWVARGGGLPDYIQHVAHDLVEKRGKTESEAIQMAIGIVKRWAAGGGKVDANTRAAAAKAVAEWEKLKAKNAAKGGKIKEAPVGYLAMELGEADLGDLSLLEAKMDAEDKKDGGTDEATEDMPSVYCVKDSKKVTPTKDKKCPTCGADLSKAVAVANKVSEAPLSSKERGSLPKSAFAIPEKAPGPGSYPIDDLPHARNALARAAGKPEEARVKAAVYKRYPQLKQAA